jgi:hypothetical protein
MTPGILALRSSHVLSDRRLDREARERFMGIGQVLTMPFFFVSNAIDPLGRMPYWLPHFEAESSDVSSRRAPASNDCRPSNNFRRANRSVPDGAGFGLYPTIIA